MTGDSTTAADGSTDRPERTFTISEAFLSTRRRLMIGLLALLTGVPWAVVLLEPGGHRRFVALAPFLVVFNIAVVVGSGLLGSYISRQWRRTRLVVGPTGFAREAGPARDIVGWDDVTRLRVRHDRSDVPTLVEVFRVGGRPLYLHGFGGMSELVSDLRTHIPQTASYVSKPQWAIASDTPAVRISFVAAVMVATFALTAVLGRGVMDRVTGIVNVALGVWMIGFRPMSRTNPGFRVIDVGVGLMSLASAWRYLG
jgi:hypothetical protein